MLYTAIVSLFLVGARAGATETCPAREHCKWEDQYLATRLWNVVPTLSGTANRVLNEFNEGFTPVAKSADGFRAYIGAAPPDTTLAFFMNVFQTESEAEGVNVGAAAFKANNGVLSNTITPKRFSEGKIAYQITSDDFCAYAPDIQSFYLSVREYIVLPGGTSEQLTHSAEVGLGPTMKSYDGFQMYMAATTRVTDGDGSNGVEDGSTIVVFINVFETLDEADKANAMAAEWVGGTGAFADQKYEGAGGYAGYFDGKGRNVNGYTAKINFAHFCRGFIPTCPTSSHCSMWCNVYTCGASSCEGCNACSALRMGKYCGSWCNSYTSGASVCAGCSH